MDKSYRVPSNFVVNEHEGYSTQGITSLTVSTVTERNGVSMRLPLQVMQTLKPNLETQLLLRQVSAAVVEQIDAGLIQDIVERGQPKELTATIHIRLSRSGSYEP